MFADGGKTPDPSQRTYSDVMKEKRLAQDGVSAKLLFGNIIFYLKELELGITVWKYNILSERARIRNL